MITWLPYCPNTEPDKIAACLRDEDLRMQISNATTVERALLQLKGLWDLDPMSQTKMSSPGVTLWYNEGRPHLRALLRLERVLDEEWIRRGHGRNPDRFTSEVFVRNLPHMFTVAPVPWPKECQQLHRVILWQKDPEHYRRYFGEIMVSDPDPTELMRLSVEFATGLNEEAQVEKYRLVADRLQEVLKGN